MSTHPDQRQPKIRQDIATRQIRTGGDPESTETETIAWQFRRFDKDHPDWGWRKLKAPQWKVVLTHLIDFEGLTWASLKAQSGGRRKGTNHHSLDISKLPAKTRQRWTDLGLDDYDTVFSLRITNTLRLYGVRDGRVMALIWHDPFHGSKRGACPTGNC
jgi:hypothetical protein